MDTKVLLNEARSLQSKTVEDRRFFHTHPETGYDLDETCAYVKKSLEDLGYKPEEIVDSGLIACVGNKPSPCVLLRFDMDALPIEEKTGLPFASTNGCMHACGHDLHVAIGLCVARLLKQHEDELEGCVKLCFQPDEEAVDPREDTGNPLMIKAGMLKNPDVDAAMTLHVNTLEVETGKVAIKPGTSHMSIDDVDIEVIGKSTHGAMPQEGVDPINIAAHIYLAMQEVISRRCDPTKTCVLTFGKFTSGSAANIIPKSANLLGTLRTADEASRISMQKDIKQICEGIAHGFGGECKVQFLRGVPTNYNDPNLAEELVGYIEGCTGDEVEILESAKGGSDDFGSTSHEVPSCYFLLGAADPNCEPLPLHNEAVMFDEDAMPLGAASIAAATIEYIKNH